MREIRKTELIMVGLVVLSFIISASFYAHLPKQIPSNWNDKGEAFQYIPKFQGAFLLPFVNVGVLLLTVILSRVKPSFDKKKRFVQYYDKFVILFLCWYICVQLQILLWAFDVKIEFLFVFLIGLGVLCFHFGVMFTNAKKDWFIALRSRWTLNSEEAWKKTHKTGGRYIKIAGVVTIISAFIPKPYSMFISAFSIAVVGCGLIIYACIFGHFKYRQQMKGSKAC
ncbi:MAG: SdpI family protein [Planctomycetota bacterium]|jgi:uncharacterized membrane protein